MGNKMWLACAMCVILNLSAAFKVILQVFLVILHLGMVAPETTVAILKLFVAVFKYLQQFWGYPGLFWRTHGHFEPADNPDQVVATPHLTHFIQLDQLFSIYEFCIRQGLQKPNPRGYIRNWLYWAIFDKKYCICVQYWYAFEREDISYLYSAE